MVVSKPFGKIRLSSTRDAAYEHKPLRFHRYSLSPYVRR
jgi:hypothetical protein